MQSFKAWGHTLASTRWPKDGHGLCYSKHICDLEECSNLQVLQSRDFGLGLNYHLEHVEYALIFAIIFCSPQQTGINNLNIGFDSPITQLSSSRNSTRFVDASSGLSTECIPGYITLIFESFPVDSISLPTLRGLFERY